LREQIVRLERLMRHQVRQEVEIEASAWFVHEGVAMLLELFQHAFPEAIPDALAFLHQQLEYYPPAGENPDPDGFEAFIAKKSAAKRKMEGNGLDDDWEEGTSRKRRRLQKKVVEDEMDVDTDVPVRDRSASWESFPEVAIETEWPAGLRMTDSLLSDFEGVAGPSGLSTEEKQKTPVEMEIEDVAGPSGDPNANVKPVNKPVKVEEVPVDVNQPRYKIVEVPPRVPAQPVIESAPANEETQPVTTEADGEAAVEPKPELVEQPMPPADVELIETQLKELKITTHKNDAGKLVIEILDSDDEMPAEEKGKEKEPDEEPEAKDGDEKVPDS
jgi:hypothetical protein